MVVGVEGGGVIISNCQGVGMNGGSEEWVGGGGGRGLGLGVK